MTKHLIIGALPPPIGGTTVLFSQLVDELSRMDGLEVITIDAKAKSASVTSKFTALFRTLGGVIRNIHSTHSVGFHGSLNGALVFYPILRLICFIYRKPIIFRGFGGNFDIVHMALGRLKKMLMKYSVLTSDIVLFETKKSVDYFSSISNSRIIWYSNSRPYNAKLSCKPALSNDTGLKVVFIGHVKPTKGIRELVDAVNGVAHNVQLDIYGPLQDGVLESELNGINSRYCGVVDPDQVSATMSEYDLLALPTYYEGEGYPGVILEAYTLGLPVLATRWRCIPEIVNESSGILVEPGSVDSIKDALEVLNVNNSLYKTLSNGACQRAIEFSSIEWTKRYYEIVKNIER